jgi:hypothetical protein
VCFGHIQPSSRVFYLAKIVALYVKISFPVWTWYFLIKINWPQLKLIKLINIPMFSLCSSSSLLTLSQPPPYYDRISIMKMWDVVLCGSYVSPRFGGTYRLHLQPPAHAGSSLADFSTLKMEAIRSSETSVHTRSTRRHIPEDGILHSHNRENLKSYIQSVLLSDIAEDSAWN